MSEPMMMEPPELQGPVKWYEITFQDAHVAWEGLVPFVHWLVRRFAVDAKEIPPCWHSHEPIIEELAAIWTAYEVNYDSTSPGSAAPAWLRELEWTLGRTRAVIAKSGCTVREHRGDRVEEWPDSEDYLQALATSKKAEFAVYAHQQSERAKAELAAASSEWG